MTDFQYKPRQQALDVDDEGLLEQLTKLGAQLSLTQGVAADILGVARSTFMKFLKEQPRAKDAWTMGRAMGKVDFAKTGFLHARSDPATWRFLAKQDRYLGMSDNPKLDKPLGDAATASAKRMTREEATARILELSRKLPVEIDGDAEEVQPPANQSRTGRSIARRG